MQSNPQLCTQKGIDHKLLVIVGPTASGKSDLAVELAREYGGEIISADSRQVYRGLDLGSGKVPRDPIGSLGNPPTPYHIPPTPYFHKGIPHHLLDVASPKRTFTVAHYQKLAEKALLDILRRGKLPIITGGTGLYIDALLYETIFPEVKPDRRLRARLEKESPPELFAELLSLDPERAASIDKHNKRRLVRALEIIHATGKPVPLPSPRHHAHILKKVDIMPEDVLKIGIDPLKEVLQKRIHDRLLKRLRQGMIAEVRRLQEEGVSWKKLDDFGLEYRWISRYLRGLVGKTEMLERIEKESLQYARRQMTWWKKDKDIQWFDSPESAFRKASRL